MELAANRVVTVFGLGNIGKRAFDLARANGLTVQAVDIRARELSQRYGDDVKFVTKDEACLLYTSRAGHRPARFLELMALGLCSLVRNLRPREERPAVLDCLDTMCNIREKDNNL